MSIFRKLEQDSQRVLKKASPAISSGIKLDVATTKNVDQSLKRIPWELRHKVLLQAGRKSGNVVVNEARRILRTRDNIDRGDLIKSIKVKTVTYDDDGRIVAVVGPSWPQGNHGMLLELGTSRQPPRPFIRPAANSTKPAQQKAFEDHVKKRAEKI